MQARPEQQGLYNMGAADRAEFGAWFQGFAAGLTSATRCQYCSLARPKRRAAGPAKLCWRGVEGLAGWASDSLTLYPLFGRQRMLPHRAAFYSAHQFSPDGRHLPCHLTPALTSGV